MPRASKGPVYWGRVKWVAWVMIPDNAHGVGQGHNLADGPGFLHHFEDHFGFHRRRLLFSHQSLSVPRERLAHLSNFLGPLYFPQGALFWRWCEDASPFDIGPQTVGFFATGSLSLSWIASYWWRCGRVARTRSPCPSFSGRRTQTRRRRYLAEQCERTWPLM